MDKFNVSNFFHVKNNMKIVDPGMYGWGWPRCKGFGKGSALLGTVTAGRSLA